MCSTSLGGEVDLQMTEADLDSHDVVNSGQIVINQGYGNALIIDKDELYSDVKATVQMAGTISGFAFRDNSGDGIYTEESTDRKEAGVPVELYSSDGEFRVFAN